MSLYHHLQAQLFPPQQGQQPFIPQFRIESRARNPNTEDGLAMRIADPLWMLGRQWQFGEFLGEDNASPVSVKINYQVRQLNRLGADEDQLQAIDVNQYPFEFCIESIPQKELNLRQRVQAGQQLERLLKIQRPTDSSEIIHQFRSEYPLKENDLNTELDPSSRGFYRLMRGRAIDGQKAYLAFQQMESIADTILATWQQYARWYRQQFNLQEASEQDYWQETQLLHRFKAKYEAEVEGIAEELLLQSSDYQSGQLDWYSFDHLAKVTWPLGGTAKASEELQPVSLSFAAMPDQRLYTFEDNKVDLGSMEIEPSDLLRLMLINFSYLSSNDWFIIPLEMALGEVAWIENIEVQDAFGITTIIKNGLGEEDKQIGPILDADPLKVWDVFKIRSEPLTQYHPAHDGMLLAPALGRRQQSQPLEEVLLLRDEYANMVWGLEKTVQNALGQARNGFDQHRALHGSPVDLPHQNAVLLDERGSPLPEFRLSSTVPFNWIPYLPVHKEGQDREIELWRARILHPDEAREIAPLSELIRRDLGHLREEAVPRSGVRVQLTRQRVRWVDGSTHVWYGRNVLPGRGEGSSGLRFDELVNRETEEDD